MVTQQTATIYITNRTDGHAGILLYHTNSSHGTQRESWNAGPGQTVGPMTVYFETGLGTGGILDYWSVMLNVSGGSTPGQYITSGTAIEPYWKPCQLKHGDAGKTITLSVDTTTFEVALASGGCMGGMTRLAPYSPITNVFVVMLENQSFDRLFAMSEIPGILAATTRDSNSHDGTVYHVQNGAPVAMPTDPGHEFLDVVEQLGGEGAEYPPGGPYPAINNSGFAANYATSTTEGPASPQDDIGDVMACFGTQSQLPVFYQLATQFALCDQWFSSLPGPTWPNRYFVHGASSSGLDDSPSLVQMGKWEIDGFPFPRGSIFQALDNASIQYRFYSDFDPSPGSSYGLSLFSDDPQSGSLAGAIPQASSLQGVSLMDFHSLSSFASDLQGPYPCTYTFIEPHYGDIARGTYAGGSSQHPVDDIAGGQNLVQAVYEAIRNSPYWNSSLLIITFDEHGGFYDSVAPGAATAPGDHPHDGLNKHGFTFEQYGPRVPAIVVSPLIVAGTVDHTVYDHASVLATLERLFGLQALTRRDAAASDVTHLFTQAAPRGDCPAKLNHPAPLLKAARRALPDEELAEIDEQPLPESGDLRGALSILLKTEIELSSRSPAAIAGLIAKVKRIRTRGEARAYIASVMAKVRAARAAGVRTR
jgi:phospholipase C